MSRTSFAMSVLVIAALIALFLGAVGIYGVLSYVVSLRIPEIGTRLALGASPGAVRRMVLSQGMRLAGAGALMGLVAAIAVGRVMVALLYGVSPFDPVTLVATSAIFLSVAVLASLVPAARAARTAPVDALRELTMVFCKNGALLTISVYLIERTLTWFTDVRVLSTMTSGIHGNRHHHALDQVACSNVRPRLIGPNKCANSPLNRYRVLNSVRSSFSLQ